MIDLFIRALAPALPDVVVAGQPADAMNIMFTGRQPETAHHFVCGEATAVGWGAHAERRRHERPDQLRRRRPEELPGRGDRVAATRFGSTATGCGPDSGGGGHAPRRPWRSCASTRRSRTTARAVPVVRANSDPRLGAVRRRGGSCDERDSRPRGGGRARSSRSTACSLPRGSRVVVRTGGGGGFGDPDERDTEALERDLLDGYVTSPTRYRPGRSITMKFRAWSVLAALTLTCVRRLGGRDGHRRPASIRLRRSPSSSRTSPRRRRSIQRSRSARTVSSSSATSTRASSSTSPAARTCGRCSQLDGRSPRTGSSTRSRSARASSSRTALPSMPRPPSSASTGSRASTRGPRA